MIDLILVLFPALVRSERSNVGGHVVLEQVITIITVVVVVVITNIIIVVTIIIIIVILSVIIINFIPTNRQGQCYRRDDLNMMVEGAWNLGVTGLDLARF